ncbi:MAG: PIG-L family deacetylase [Bryobacteraceae bacterium]|nr:PIG-L family deacetylase [Bryobacteraceae bacterium]
MNATVDDCFRRGPILILAAHPDDEAIGAGGILDRLPDPILAFLTDGAPRQHPRAEELARRRRAESEAAWELTGSEERILRLGGADQECALDLPGLTRAAGIIALTRKPTTILTHPYEGGHPDHDSAAFIARQVIRVFEAACLPPPQIVEFTSYHNGTPFAAKPELRTGQFLPGGGEVRVFHLSASRAEVKRKMFARYESQQAMLRHFPIETEKFRIAPRYDFSKPPHAGTLFYEMQPWGLDGATWRRLVAEADKALEPAPAG